MRARREMLRESKVGPGARWSKVKETVSGDARYRALPRDAREPLFRAFVAEAEVRALRLIRLPCMRSKAAVLECHVESSTDGV